MHDGIKAVDIIAIDPQKTVWLIEAKDYRTHRRSKTIPIIDEIWQKVFATLAALLPAKVNASSGEENDFAAKILGGHYSYVQRTTDLLAHYELFS